MKLRTFVKEKMSRSANKRRSSSRTRRRQRDEETAEYDEEIYEDNAKRNSSSRKRRSRRKRRTKHKSSYFTCHPKRFFFLILISFIYYYYYDSIMVSVHDLVPNINLSELSNYPSEDERSVELRKNDSETRAMQDKTTEPTIVIETKIETKIEKVSVDMTEVCPIDFDSATLILNFYGYDLFNQQQVYPSIDYFTGTLKCKNCLENEIRYENPNNGFVYIATCSYKPCLFEDKQFESDKNENECSETEFKFDCKYGMTENPTIFNYNSLDDNIDFRIISEEITCREAGGRNGTKRVKCPPCQLEIEIEMKTGYIWKFLEIAQFVIFSITMLYLGYRVILRLREYNNEDESEDDDIEETEEEEGESGSEQEDVVLEEKDITEDLQNRRQKAKSLLQKLDFTSKNSKSKRIVSEEEFKKLKKSGELKGKKVSRIEVEVSDDE